MFPTLSIGSIALPTYPLLLLIALWVGMGVAAGYAQRLQIDGDHVYNAGLYGLIAWIVGARLWFVLSHWENYGPNPLQAFSLSRSALSVEEGLIVAGLVILVYLKRYRLPLGLFADAVAPGLALALAIGHLGAFLGGDALGMPATVPWAVEIGGVARHPAQLYIALSSLVIFLLLTMVGRWRPWAGFQIWLWLALYSLSRLFLEVFMARPAVVGDGFLAVQVAALGGLVLALAVMAYRFSGHPVQVEVENYEVVG